VQVGDGSAEPSTPAASRPGCAAPPAINQADLIDLIVEA